MRNKEIKVSVPGPRLPVVLRELVERICADEPMLKAVPGCAGFED
jgi:hypothetical protein